MPLGPCQWFNNLINWFPIPIPFSNTTLFPNHCHLELCTKCSRNGATIIEWGVKRVYRTARGSQSISGANFPPEFPFDLRPRYVPTRNFLMLGQVSFYKFKPINKDLCEEIGWQGNEVGEAIRARDTLLSKGNMHLLSRLGIASYSIYIIERLIKRETVLENRICICVYLGIWLEIPLHSKGNM